MALRYDMMAFSASKIIDKQRLVEDQLRMYSGKKVPGPEATAVLCPFHSERTPSCRIFHGPKSYSPGYFVCMGCGAKGKWDIIAPALGLQPFKGGPITALEARMIAPLKEDETQDSTDFELKKLPSKRMWRGFETDWLAGVGCKLMVTSWGSKFVWMPVKVGGRTKGYIRARLKKDPEGKKPSYLNKSGTWSKTHGLFPFDYAIEMAGRSRTIVLVEGPRDALRLLSYGIPAMAILGTNTWSSKKMDLLEVHGIRRIILMLDGDPAGIAATEKIAPGLDSMFKTRVLKLWNMRGSPYREWWKALEKRDPAEAKARKGELWDACSCPDWVLDGIKERFFSRLESK